jgi:hypothetical protein
MYFTLSLYLKSFRKRKHTMDDEPSGSKRVKLSSPSGSHRLRSSKTKMSLKRSATRSPTSGYIKPSKLVVLDIPGASTATAVTTEASYQSPPQEMPPTTAGSMAGFGSLVDFTPPMHYVNPMATIYLCDSDDDDL